MSLFRPVRDLEGRLQYFIAMVKNVTELKRIEEALRVEREQVQAAKLLAESNARETAEKWFEALVEISRRISHMENIDEVLIHVVRQSRELLNCDTVSFGLLDDAGARLQIAYQAAGDRAQVLNPPLSFENAPLLQIFEWRNFLPFPGGCHRR